MIGMRKFVGVAEALQALAPQAQWVVRDNDYDQIEWHSENFEQPSKEVIEAKVAELESAAPMNAVREIRDWYLQACDWTQGQDIRALRGAEWCAAWDTYRQQLRDITSSGIEPYFGNMDEILGVTFPEKPSA